MTEPWYKRPGSLDELQGVLSAMQVPKDGFGVNLVHVTDAVFPRVESHDEMLKARPAQIHDMPSAAALPTHVREGVRERKMVGTLCSRPACDVHETSWDKPTMKRCGRVSDRHNAIGADVHDLCVFHSAFRRSIAAHRYVFSTSITANDLLRFAVQCQRGDW